MDHKTIDLGYWHLFFQAFGGKASVKRSYTGEKTLVLVEVNVRPNCWRKKCARLLWPWRRAAGLGTVRHNNATSNCRYLERYGFFLFFYLSFNLPYEQWPRWPFNSEPDFSTTFLLFRSFFFWKRFQGLIYNTSVIFESRELLLPRHILGRTFK